MPIITVTLIEGYSADVREQLSHRLTDAARGAIGAPLDGISVVLNEVPSANYMRGGAHRVPGTPPPSASKTVRSYLGLMQDRDLDGAKALLGDGFTMTFPGPITFNTPEELAGWAKDRYRFVKKSYTRFDEMTGEDGSIVYCFGTLEGEWPDGEAFSDIRFIDRFTVLNGKLMDQMVWNDLAEIRLSSNPQI